MVLTWGAFLIAAALVFLLYYSTREKESDSDMPIELDDRGRALENEYFRRKERELIEKMKAKAAAEGTKPNEFSCPKCGGKLAETDYENIKIDVCSGCGGIWIDPGEAAQIAARDKGKEGWFGGLFK